jgi:hypothetical protein
MGGGFLFLEIKKSGFIEEVALVLIVLQPMISEQRHQPRLIHANRDLHFDN